MNSSTMVTATNVEPSTVSVVDVRPSAVVQHPTQVIGASPGIATAFTLDLFIVPFRHPNDGAHNGLPGCDVNHRFSSLGLTV